MAYNNYLQRILQSSHPVRARLHRQKTVQDRNAAPCQEPHHHAGKQWIINDFFLHLHFVCYILCPLQSSHLVSCLKKIPEMGCFKIGRRSKQWRSPRVPLPRELFDSIDITDVITFHVHKQSTQGVLLFLMIVSQMLFPLHMVSLSDPFPPFTSFLPNPIRLHSHDTDR